MTKARDLANASTALSAVSATELAFVDGVTSAIQTQMDAKAPSSTAVTLTGTQTLTNKTLTSPVIASVINNTLTSTTGDIIYASGANTPARLGIGSSAQVLTVASGIPSWATPAASTPTFVGCSIYNSASGSHPNNTETMLTFDSEFFDTDSFHSTATNTGRVTIPAGKAGKYAVHYSVRPVANSTGYRYLAIYKNNVSFVQLMEVVANGTVSATGARSVIIDLAVADYLTFYYYQNSGGAMTTYYREYEHPVQVQWLGA